MDGADRVYLVRIFESTSFRSRARRETIEAPEHRARELCHLWGLSYLHSRYLLHPSRLRMGVKLGHHVSRPEADTIPQLEMGHIILVTPLVDHRTSELRGRRQLGGKGYRWYSFPLFPG
jgi:hypothetical protein